MKKPYEIIKIDRYTGRIQQPNLLLTNRSGNIIGRINKYENWNISLVGNGMDEIEFEVSKYCNGEKCPIWDDLIDLKLIEASGFGRFEISVDYTDNTKTVKAVHGVSLETELAQIPLYEFHVNDDEATSAEMTGNFIPTVFHNPKDEEHSLLHRVLADKAPHWGIGYVTPFISLSEESQPEPSDSFQRTYTVDGDSIYDFLTGTVAEESNVIFVFDTLHREISCYSLCDCIDQETGNIWANSIGKDTTVFVSKTKLAKEITISSNKDSVKNCFRVEGGDDVITDMVRAVNMNGSNYINVFSNIQYDDMSEELSNKLKKYQSDFSAQEEKYIGENGIYTRLCQKYEELSYYESAMMPNVVIKETTAEEQYNEIIKQLDASIEGHTIVGVSSTNYTDDLFIGVTNNIQAFAQILVDSRYDVSIIDNSTSYDSDKKQWNGNFIVRRATDENDYFPKTSEDINRRVAVEINSDELLFARQKIEKALSKGSMLDIDFDVAEMADNEIYNYFDLYSLNRLKSFYDGYNSCISILTTMGMSTTGLDTDSPVRIEIYDIYKHRLDIVEEIYEKRKSQVEEINKEIGLIKEEQSFFQKQWDLKTYLGDELYKEYCSYRREDTYQNDNYISDGLSTSECLAKSKELIEVAAQEAKKACVLQRTISVSLNNLFAIPEFEPLYEKFAMFNYIRIRTEDEILKLRIIGIEFDGNSIEQIQVTFSDQIESIDGEIDDTASILKQAASMSSSYPSTILQAKQGASAKNIVSEIYNTGLNAAKAMITNSDNNEVTITQSGIICRRMDDEGYYGEKQIRIIGNMIAFTRNAWDSVELAIGETTFVDPDGNTKKAYGIIAENIVGKLMVSERTYIGNEDGSVEITGDGIKITNGTIAWENVNAPEMSDIDGLQQSFTAIDNSLMEINDFKSKVNQALTGSAATEIGSDYIISPKIGGGYLYIKDKRTTNGTGISVEINPNGTNFPGHNSGYVFNISNSNNLIMGVDNKGGGYFSGEIEASSGHIGGTNGWLIESGQISSYNNGKNGKIRLDSTISKISASYTYESQDIERIAELSEGSFVLHYDSDEIGRLHSTLWSNTQEKGMAIYCKPDSKFLVIGHDNTKGDNTYIPDIVINNGLDNNGRKESIQLLTDTYMANKLYFNTGYYLNGWTAEGIICSNNFCTAGRLFVGNTILADGIHKLNVDGTGFINGDLYCNSQITGNMVHMFVQNGTHKGALAVNGNKFGLWDATYDKWMIHVDENKQVVVANTLSDFRLKSNITNTSVNNALNQILSIKHKSFTFNDNGIQKDIGYIAQELEKINPKMVIAPRNEDDYYYVDSFYLEAVITKAIQEFYKEYIGTILELNKRIKILENQGEN